MPATMTLYGLVQWDNTLFDSLVLPDYDELDRYDLANMIMLECAEMEVLYPNPDFLKQAMRSWSRSRKVPWTHYINVMKAEYSPIENTDRHETHSVIRDGNESKTSNRDEDSSRETSRIVKGSHTSNRQETASNTLSTSRDSTSNTTSTRKTEETYSDTDKYTGTTTTQGTDTHRVAAFNTTSGMVDSTQDTSSKQDTVTSQDNKVGLKQLDERDVNNSSATNTGKDIGTNNVRNVDSDTNNQSDMGEDVVKLGVRGSESTKRGETETETIHAHGNIGVTTNQQMMTEEVNFWVWDLYSQIAREFRRMFCVSVY